MSTSDLFRDIQLVEMTDKEYFALDRLNASTLKRLKTEGPVVIGAEKRHGPGDPSDAMRLGSLVHCMVLEPDAVSTRYVAFGGTRRGKAWDAFVADNTGPEIVTAKDYAKATAMAGSVKSHDEAMKVLKGDHEMVLLWTMLLFGQSIPMKAKLDNLGQGWACDLKTTLDASVEGFGRQIGNHAYHIQVALYHDAAKALQGVDEFKFPIVAVDNRKMPFPVGVHELSQDFMDLGRQAYRDGIGEWLLWERRGWPVHHTDSEVNIIEPPKWL